ncbi:MAG: hypothetical protein II328_02220, partial [Clostridia bacterium]|nr:hypothetical protein [Clostridia bacterium]
AALVQRLEEIRGGENLRHSGQNRSTPASIESLVTNIIHEIGVQKARQLIAMARKLLSDFGGEVPSTQKELLSLPGVGTKIANLLLGDVFGQPAIVADTHMIRLSRRWGFSDSADQHKVEAALEKVTPVADRADFCHRAVLFGREYCRAQSPACDACPLFLSEEV